MAAVECSIETTESFDYQNSLPCKDPSIAVRRSAQRHYGRRLPHDIKTYKADAIMIKTGEAETGDGMQEGIAYSVNKQNRWSAVDSPTRFVAAVQGDAPVTLVDAHVYGDLKKSVKTGVNAVYHKDSEDNVTEKRLRGYTSMENCEKTLLEKEAGPSVEYNVYRGSPNPNLLKAKRGKTFSKDAVRHKQKFDEDYSMEGEEEKEEEEEAGPRRAAATLADFIPSKTNFQMGMYKDDYVWVD